MYNIDFLIASVAFVILVVPFYVAGHNRSKSVSSVTFTWFLLLGTLDIILDIVTALMYTDALTYPIWLLQVASCAFYMLQCLVPLMLFLYVVALAGGVSRDHSTFLAICVTPFLAMTLLVLTNPFTGALFSFEPDTHAYSHGYAYVLTYAHAVFYACAAIGYTLFNRNELRRVEIMAIVSFVVLTICTCILQFVFQGVLLTGLGIGLGAIIFLVTLTNPFDMTDALTGTLDLGVFTRRVTSLIDKRRSFGVVFVSLDNLNIMNSVGGRGFGDNILRACAKDLMRLSKDGRVYRLKGTRFAILTDSMRETRRVYGDLESYFSIPHYIGGRTVKIEASIWRIEDGAMVISPEEMQGYMDYLVVSMRNKELANFDKSTGLESYRRYNMVHQCIAGAIQNDSFELYAQPLLDVKSGGFTSFEALSRLSHPELGYIPPSEFIAIAEEEGDIVSISELQFEKICKFLENNLEELRAVGWETVKVNLSPIELAQMNAPERILECIQRHGLDLSMFCFEITESCATEYSSELDRFIDMVIRRGASLYIDDFGSGFANFDMLVRLPFTGIKIDKTLLGETEDNPKTTALYQGIVKMMKEIGLSVVSEGVETESQDAMLRNLGVDVLQGFLYAKPMPVDSLCNFVQETMIDN